MSAVSAWKQRARREQIFEKAKEVFGTTEDVREAGWILPSGQMLDFSGYYHKHTTPYDPYAHRETIGKGLVHDAIRAALPQHPPMRMADHSEVAFALPSGRGFDDPTRTFQKLGAIRMHYGRSTRDPFFSFELLDVKPTKKQWKRIGIYTENPELIIFSSVEREHKTRHGWATLFPFSAGHDVKGSPSFIPRFKWFRRGIMKETLL